MKRFFSTLCISTLFLSPAFGEPTESSFDPPLSESTATKVALAIDDAPAPVSVISRKQILDHGYRNLAEALAQIPEVYVHYDGHNFSTDFRGFWQNNTQRRILFLLNGHRLNDRFHSGDFYADLIGDLQNVERIEVVRGPGSAVYGTTAVLGVVNVITRDAANLPIGEPTVDLSASLDYLSSDSHLQKYQATLRHRISENAHFTLDLYWFKGDVRYDTKTNWNSSAAWQAGNADLLLRHDFYAKVDDASFEGGYQIPSFTADITWGDLKMGAFVHSKSTSWVWPRANSTFNHEDNSRSWGTSAVFVEYRPREIEEDLLVRVSYSLNTNREISDFSTQDVMADGNSLSYHRRDAFGGTAFRQNGDEFYDYNASLDLDTLFSDAAANVHGGGTQLNHAGIDRSIDLEFLITPYKNDSLNITLGGNLGLADYDSYHWYAYRDRQFIAWAPGGGTKDTGWYTGLWLQSIFSPIESLMLIVGGRFDHQRIVDVRRSLGSNKLYRLVEGEHVAVQREGVEATNFSPRISLRYELTDKTNIRLLWTRAFRAIPPQEVIQLPLLADAPSEHSNNFEGILSYSPVENLNLTLNLFHHWSSDSLGRNTGGSLTGIYSLPRGISTWFSLTYYHLKRPTDAFGFMRDDKSLDAFLALDSPRLLAKMGASYTFDTKTTLALEIHYNGNIEEVMPTNNNVGDPDPTEPGVPNYLLHEIPDSLYVNFNVRQDLEPIGLDDFFLSLKVLNLTGTDEWYVLNWEAQRSWDNRVYQRPNQLPGFGTRFYLLLQKQF